MKMIRRISVLGLFFFTLLSGTELKAQANWEAGMRFGKGAKFVKAN